MVEENKTPAPKNAPKLLKKREQIHSNNKQLFLWVAGASVIVAFAIVATIFLSKQLLFNEKVLSEKDVSVNDLTKSLQNAKVLNENINNLASDRNLKLARSGSTESNLDVVIDALPYDGDLINLGASLQNVIITGISIDSLGVSDSAIAVDPSAGVAAESAVTIGSSQPLQFTFKATGTVEEVQKFFDRLNHSIRPIKVVNMQLESAGAGKISVNVSAETYYQPKKSFELTEKVVKP